MRLIDADELIKRMDALKWKIASDTTNLEIIGIKFANEMNNNLQVIVSNMQTAYDVDKVVEELENETHIYFNKNTNELVPLEEAIELVKRGGKNDD